MTSSSYESVFPVIILTVFNSGINVFCVFYCLLTKVKLFVKFCSLTYVGRTYVLEIFGNCNSCLVETWLITMKWNRT